MNALVVLGSYKGVAFPGLELQKYGWPLLLDRDPCVLHPTDITNASVHSNGLKHSPPPRALLCISTSWEKNRESVKYSSCLLKALPPIFKVAGVCMNVEVVREEEEATNINMQNNLPVPRIEKSALMWTLCRQGAGAINECRCRGAQPLAEGRFQLQQEATETESQFLFGRTSFENLIYANVGE